MVPTKHVFPDSFFSEEDRLGFHIDRQRKELWAIELDMLYELDRVCKKLNVKYFLEAGTLLGAARDGLFIPWDDDIDVSMLREDYDRFLRDAPKEFQYPYFLQTGYTEENYIRGHSQLRRSDTCAILPCEQGRETFNQGIFLDIFVLDALFPEHVEAQFQEKAALSEYVDSLFFFDRPEEIHLFPRAWLEETVDLPFEDGLFPVPIGYREYLAVYYGENWQTPQNTPSIHNAAGQVIIDTERPYTDYLKNLPKW